MEKVEIRERKSRKETGSDFWGRFMFSLVLIESALN